MQKKQKSIKRLKKGVAEMQNKLIILKLRLGIEGVEKDPLLLTLLDSAKNYILSYTGRKEEKWIPIFDDIQVKIASIDYNKLGIENLSSQTEGSISNSYIDDYPKDITNILNKYRVCRVV